MLRQKMICAPLAALDHAHRRSLQAPEHARENDHHDAEPPVTRLGRTRALRDVDVGARVTVFPSRCHLEAPEQSLRGRTSRDDGHAVRRESSLRAHSTARGAGVRPTRGFVLFAESTEHRIGGVFRSGAGARHDSPVAIVAMSASATGIGSRRFSRTATERHVPSRSRHAPDSCAKWLSSINADCPESRTRSWYRTDR